jgi:hypothetical protein
MYNLTILNLPIETRKAVDAYVDKFGKGTDTDLITRSMMLGGETDVAMFNNIVFSAIKKGVRIDGYELENRIEKIPDGAKT